MLFQINYRYWIINNLQGINILYPGTIWLQNLPEDQEIWLGVQYLIGCDSSNFSPTHHIPWGKELASNDDGGQAPEEAGRWILADWHCIECHSKARYLLAASVTHSLYLQLFTSTRSLYGHTPTSARSCNNQGGGYLEYILEIMYLKISN